MSKHPKQPKVYQALLVVFMLLCTSALVCVYVLHSLAQPYIISLDPFAGKSVHASAPLAQVVAANDNPTLLEAGYDDTSFTLRIPKLQLSVPVLRAPKLHWERHEWAQLEEQMQIGLRYGLVAYPHSVLPSETGTMIIAGHSSPPDAITATSEFAHVFARLPELKIGDEVTVQSETGKKIYRVDSARIVSSKETNVLLPETGRDVLRLITCYPIGTSQKRLVITASALL